MNIEPAFDNSSKVSHCDVAIYSTPKKHVNIYREWICSKLASLICMAICC